MPNRILRDCTDSEPVNGLSVHAERLFYRLIQKADDYGRLTGNDRILRPLLFPLLLDQVREADVQRWIAECEKSGLVRRYECEGKSFLEIEKFGQRIRAEKSKFPEPPPKNGRHMTVTCQSSDSRMRPEAIVVCDSRETKTKAHAAGVGFDSPDFQQAWADYVEMRKQNKWKLSKIGESKLLKKLESWGEENAIAALRKSTESDWRGVYNQEENRQKTPVIPANPLGPVVYPGSEVTLENE